jgi:hypothetical protein
MANQRDWLYRPVRAGMCKAESLYDGVLDLDAIADMNEAMDVAEENRQRYHNYAAQRQDSG